MPTLYKEINALCAGSRWGKCKGCKGSWPKWMGNPPPWKRDRLSNKLLLLANSKYAHAWFLCVSDSKLFLCAVYKWTTCQYPKLAFILCTPVLMVAKVIPILEVQVSGCLISFMACIGLNARFHALFSEQYPFIYSTTLILCRFLSL